MLKVEQLVEQGRLEQDSKAEAEGSLLKIELPYDERKKSRLKTQTVCGVDVGLFLERGHVLKAGDLLLANSGELLEVLAASEQVSTVRCSDELSLLKIAYHLGNRHMPVEIDQDDKGLYLRYQQDYVLDDMVRFLGAEVMHEQAAFNPESGAYGQFAMQGGHSHGRHHGHHNSHHDH